MPTALGVHIYSGAFTLGVQKHFTVIGQWEEGPWGAATFDLNFSGIPHPLTMSQWPVESHIGKVNLLYTNPPCAPWSVIGGLKGHTDPRLQFTKNVINLAAKLKPEFFVLESVCPAWTKGKEFYEKAVKWFLAHEYAVTILLTNALLHGAPQNRARFHLIAHKYQLDLSEPGQPGVDSPLLTVDRVIGDLAESALWWGQTPSVPNHTVKPPIEGQLKVMRALKPGQHWKKVADAMIADGEEGVSKSRVISRRLLGGAPSCTMVDLKCMVHPWEDRFITLREGARLCGYPDSFVFAPAKNGTFLECPEDVTQAVLPAMGDYIGGVCRYALESGVKAEAGQMTEVDFRPLTKGFGQLDYGRKIGQWPIQNTK